MEAGRFGLPQPQNTMRVKLVLQHLFAGVVMSDKLKSTGNTDALGGLVLASTFVEIFLFDKPGFMLIGGCADVVVQIVVGIVKPF